MKTKKTALIALFTALILLLSCSICSASLYYTAYGKTTAIVVDIAYNDHSISQYVISATITQYQRGYIKISDTTTYKQLLQEMADAPGKGGTIGYSESNNNLLSIQGDFRYMFIAKNPPETTVAGPPIRVNRDKCTIKTYKIAAEFIKS